MPLSTPQVHRYRRTDLNRAGEWQPVDSPWKSVASAGLVGHDIYHHLPGDRGRFSEEVATFGAEWYIDLQPIGATFGSAKKRDLALLESNVVDTVLNALDSREALPFCLARRPADRLADDEMAYFEGLAAKALDVLNKSAGFRGPAHPDFTDRFVQVLLWGYAQAKARFPDQRRVRAECLELRHTLADMELADVPFGHEVTIALTGDTCSVTYRDADASFLHANNVVEAQLMVWCSREQGYPPKELSIHASERDYADFVDKHFMEQDGLELSAEQPAFAIALRLNRAPRCHFSRHQ